jgi:heterotetrameric sarcosine oxidase delta subunit
MMLIPCPYCGPRNVTEFTYAGDAHASRPADAPGASDAQWADYVYFRDNPRGDHDELWQHTAGCRQWIEVRRNTLSHDVIGSSLRGAKAR